MSCPAESFPPDWQAQGSRGLELFPLCLPCQLLGRDTRGREGAIEYLLSQQCNEGQWGGKGTRAVSPRQPKATINQDRPCSPKLVGKGQLS